MSVIVAIGAMALVSVVAIAYAMSISSRTLDMLIKTEEPKQPTRRGTNDAK